MGLTGLAQFAVLIAILELIKTTEQLINMIGLRTMPSNDAWRSMLSGYGILSTGIRQAKNLSKDTGKVLDKQFGTGRKTGYLDKATKNKTALGNDTRAKAPAEAAKMLGTDRAKADLMANKGKLPEGFSSIGEYVNSKQFKASMKGDGVGADTVLGAQQAKTYKKAYEDQFNKYKKSKENIASGKFTKDDLENVNIGNGKNKIDAATRVSSNVTGSKFNENGYVAALYSTTDAKTGKQASQLAIFDKSGNTLTGQEYTKAAEMLANDDKNAKFNNDTNTFEAVTFDTNSKSNIFHADLSNYTTDSNGEISGSVLKGYGDEYKYDKYTRNEKGEMVFDKEESAILTAPALTANGDFETNRIMSDGLTQTIAFNIDSGEKTVKWNSGKDPERADNYYDKETQILTKIDEEHPNRAYELDQDMKKAKKEDDSLDEDLREAYKDDGLLKTQGVESFWEKQKTKDIKEAQDNGINQGFVNEYGQPVSAEKTMKARDAYDKMYKK